VKSSQRSNADAPKAAIRCDLLAHSALFIDTEAFTSLRRQPGPGEPLSPNLLKHADEQTVAALTAVREACHSCAIGQLDFEAWGIIAAPAFIGRSMVATSLQRYAIEGAWGMSPHLIPHRIQHSVSGTISQVLNIHGPNFGTGGGPRDAGQALLAAAMLLERERVPGVWTVLTGWVPELLPEQEVPPETLCFAVALALAPMKPDGFGARITVRPRSTASAERPPQFGIPGLAAFLEGGAGGLTRQRWLLDAWGEVEFERGSFLPSFPITIPEKKTSHFRRSETAETYSAGGKHGG